MFGSENDKSIINDEYTVSGKNGPLNMSKLLYE